jgi:hypothetical protein
MPRRPQFSTEEEAHIDEFAGKRSWGHIAHDLSKDFAMVNGGSRDKQAVRNNYNRRKAKCQSTPI